MSGWVDFHVHTGPSLVPRHHIDGEIGPLLRDAGITTFVLKAHEGTTAERAALVGNGAIGSIVLNSPVGGANADAVLVAARLGARVAWMPTISSPAHQEAQQSPELQAHRGVQFQTVPVCADGRLREEWMDVLDVVADHDMILASGHLTVEETIEVFRVARQRGVQRLLVNHPMLPFLGWRDSHVDELIALDAHVEVGVLADLLAPSGAETPTVRLAKLYPHSLLVFGSDLGHSHYPDVHPGVADWLRTTEVALGYAAIDRITTITGKELLQP